MASPLFCHGFLNDLCLEALLCVHLLEPPVFIFELFEARHHGRIHAAVLGAPFIERCGTHAVLAAQLGYGGTSLRLVENSHDLAV